MNSDPDVYRLAQSCDGALVWSLRRHCSVAPSQLAMVFALLGTVSLGFAVFFWTQGAVLVMPFAVLELLALGAAFVVHARHATDGESVTIRGGQLIVESESAGEIRRSEFERGHVRLHSGGRQVLIEVRAGAQTVRIGRHLRPELRPLLLNELRRALRDV